MCQENTVVYPPLSERELNGAKIAKKVAKEGMVLLDNHENTLPLTPGPICLFGSGAVRTLRGGTGSGDPFNGGLLGGGDVNVDLSPRYHIQLIPALKKLGFSIANEEYLKEIGKRYDAAYKNQTERVMSTFVYPEEALSEKNVRQMAEDIQTAILVISRNSGEGHDRKRENDYELSLTEKENAALIRRGCNSADRAVRTGMR